MHSWVAANDASGRSESVRSCGRRRPRPATSSSWCPGQRQCSFGLGTGDFHITYEESEVHGNEHVDDHVERTMLQRYRVCGGLEYLSLGSTVFNVQ